MPRPERLINFPSAQPDTTLCFPIQSLSTAIPSQHSRYTDLSPPIESQVDEPTYPTQWRGAITLETLLNDIDVRRVAFAKASLLGYYDQDAEDCVQMGSINLWKALTAQPDLLHDKRAAWVGVYIALSGSHRGLWKHNVKAAKLDDDCVDSEPFGYSPRNRPEPWATWATRVDEQIDFAILINTLAERYLDNPIKLWALYTLTTSVQLKDVVPIVGIPSKLFAKKVGNDVRADLRALLDQDSETKSGDKFWTDQIERGENLDCITRVAEQIMDNQRLLLALYIVTTSATRKDVTELFNIPLTAFRKDIAQIKAMLAAEFRRAKHSRTTGQVANGKTGT